MKRLVLMLSFFLAVLTAFAETPVWDVQSDTWTATDGLGRTLPDAAEVGQPKPDKQIGMFYFLWHGRHGDQGPFDISKILTKDPAVIQNENSPLWGPLYAPHHWSESVFNYYVGEDEYVLRKHAVMLADAGVDVIIFDVTNQLTYPESYRPLCKVFSELRKDGNKTPQIAFLTPFWQPEKVVKELWKDFYSKGDYADLWYRWKGKPLILADKNLFVLAPYQYDFQSKIPSEAAQGHSVGQSFVSEKPMEQIAVPIPTWATNDSSATLALYEKTPGGKKLSSKKFENICDNHWYALEFTPPLPAGSYYLELTNDKGKVGWWSTLKEDKFPELQGYKDGKAVNEVRSLRLAAETDDPETKKILDFFTFRKPQPDYFAGPTGPDQWSWLEVHPQHGFYTSENIPDQNGHCKKIEQVSVGIGQNAVDGKLGVLSNPRSHGRSFHNGKEPPPEEQDFTGRNYIEQWNRAFELDPEFVFITGWNEWIAGRFPRTAPFHGSKEQAVNFVDQFNREYSRDIEPMTGGHQDLFYYQMIAFNRKFKGARTIEPVKRQDITIDGKFDDWTNVSPEFRDTIGDPAHRNSRGWGKDSQYTNETGRNDIIAAKVSYSEKKDTLYFYVRTKEPITGKGEPDWLQLRIDTDCDAETGKFGYDVVIKPENGTNVSLNANELELAVPVSALKLKELPKQILFKWTDGIKENADWPDFTRNGDTAPNDRYNYRAVLP
ncbi:MAG: hypothetical protein LBN39_08620 [Planctomycetaceae bacterium]|jgi:hypothetical protein|nr:hypothetical protein [Planctomycetaceae bacterium]